MTDKVMLILEPLFRDENVKEADALLHPVLCVVLQQILQKSFKIVRAGRKLMSLNQVKSLVNLIRSSPQTNFVQEFKICQSAEESYEFKSSQELGKSYKVKSSNKFSTRVTKLSKGGGIL